MHILYLLCRSVRRFTADRGELSADWGNIKKRGRYNEI